MVCGNPPTLDTRLDPSPRARRPLVRAPLLPAPISKAWSRQCTRPGCPGLSAALHVSERSFPARLSCCPFTIRTARACCAQLWGGGAGTQLLTPFRTVHLHTHVHDHTGVHGHFSCCTGFVCIMGLLGCTHTLMTTQPAQLMFSFVQTCFAGALPFCTTTHYAVH